jgi:hypothetical protein
VLVLLAKLRHHSLLLRDLREEDVEAVEAPTYVNLALDVGARREQRIVRARGHRGVRRVPRIAARLPHRLERVEKARGSAL